MELGQLAVIAAAAALLAVGLGTRAARWYQPTARLASASIGIAGLIWTLERIA